MKWEQTGKTVLADGGRTIVYGTKESPVKIESRKRAIPHAGRSGSWMHTTYAVIFPNGVEWTYHTLADAKRNAEEETRKYLPTF